MTNYFHLLYAGHMAFFLDRYGNLYRYSQQGWENLNSILKRTSHKNSQRGGGRKKSSKLLPIFQRMIRAMMWRTGHLLGLFQFLGYNDNIELEYGKLKHVPNFSQTTDEQLKEFAKTLFYFGEESDIEELTEYIDSDGDGEIIQTAFA